MGPHLSAYFWSSPCGRTLTVYSVQADKPLRIQ